jgi:hypothetical protein
MSVPYPTSSAGAQQTHRIFYDFQRMGKKHENEYEITRRECEVRVKQNVKVGRKYFSNPIKFRLLVHLKVVILCPLKVLLKGKIKGKD